MLKVLIADDEKPVARIYRMALARYLGDESSSEKADLENELFGEQGDSGPLAALTVCMQGAEAVDLAREAAQSGQSFGAIVLDIRMPPGIDGIEAARLIREFDTDVPIVFVSGYSDYEVNEIYEKVPPSSLISYFAKPIQLKKLAEKIREIAIYR